MSNREETEQTYGTKQGRQTAEMLKMSLAFTPLLAIFVLLVTQSLYNAGVALGVVIGASFLSALLYYVLATAVYGVKEVVLNAN